jgi:hypothetical protein
VSPPQSYDTLDGWEDKDQQDTRGPPRVFSPVTGSHMEVVTLNPGPVTQLGPSCPPHRVPVTEIPRLTKKEVSSQSSHVETVEQVSAWLLRTGFGDVYRL